MLQTMQGEITFKIWMLYFTNYSFSICSHVSRHLLYFTAWFQIKNYEDVTVKHFYKYKVFMFILYTRVILVVQILFLLEFFLVIFFSVGREKVLGRFFTQTFNEDFWDILNLIGKLIFTMCNPWVLFKFISLNVYSKRKTSF